MNEDKSVRYHRLQRRAAVLSLAVSAGGLLVLVTTGAAAALRDACVSVSGAGPSSNATVAMFVFAVVVGHEAVTFPLAFYRSFVLERRYARLAGPFRAWAGDHARAFLLTLVTAIGAAVWAYALLRLSIEWWWVIAAAVYVAVMLLVTWLFPLVLLPVFYKLSPLDRPSLTERLTSLSAKAGIPVVGAYEWGLGRKTRMANAAVVGLATTRRILVSDTMLAEYSDDEIEVILAHEIAHCVHRDLPRELVVNGLVAVAAFAAAGAALGALWRPLGLLSPADVAGLPLLVLAAAAVAVAASPLLNALSRVSERRADGFALRATGQSAAFVSAMRRLAAQNLTEERPSRLTLWLFHSHPSVDERIEMARRSNR